jgi:hypothetical protein
MPRKPVPTANPRGPPKPTGSLLQQAKGAMPTSFVEAKDSAMKYGKFVLNHVKKGEMPWTQWYCCGLVNGVEVCVLFIFLFGFAALVMRGGVRKRRGEKGMGPDRR